MEFSGEIIDMADLKGFEFDLTDAEEACKCDEVLKQVGECAGGIHEVSVVFSTSEAKQTMCCQKAGRVYQGEWVSHCS